jgi:hypothetical protein
MSLRNTGRAKLRSPEPGDAEVIVETVQGGFEGYRAFAPPGWTPPDESQRLGEIRA